MNIGDRVNIKKFKKETVNGLIKNIVGDKYYIEYLDWLNGKLKQIHGYFIEKEISVIDKKGLDSFPFGDEKRIKIICKNCQREVMMFESDLNRYCFCSECNKRITK